jgi:hypothetical protein
MSGGGCGMTSGHAAGLGVPSSVGCGNTRCDIECGLESLD